jgi:hypothetical protein
MKKHFKTLAIALLSTTITTYSYANDGQTQTSKSFDVGAYFNKNKGTIKTIVEKTEGSRVKISLHDEKGNFLDSAVLGRNKKGGIVKFDVNALPEGKYKMKINSGDEVVIREINTAIN